MKDKEMKQLRDWDNLRNCRVLITGGTGSLGNELTRLILRHSQTKSVIVYSRDEYKQHVMQSRFTKEEQERLRFFLGDVRDFDRLCRAFEGVDYVIHTAALKQVPAAEYNPFEFVQTNVIGAENVINASLNAGVKRVVALSTDKAANPVNLYGATKLCSDKMMVAGNSYSGKRDTTFSVVRYGNVMGSRGSVVPFFLSKRKDGVLPITDKRMTRFWITLHEAACLVLNALSDMRGGEIWVPKIPSMTMIDLAHVICPDAETPEIGIRPGEKLHEVMIPVDEGSRAVEFDGHYIVRPAFPWEALSARQDLGGTPCPDRFFYSSENNPQTLSPDQCSRMIADLNLPEAKEWAAERGLL